MIENVVVFASVAFAALFFLAWLLRPELRKWVEQPKYGFQKNVQSYDQAQRKGRV